MAGIELINQGYSSIKRQKLSELNFTLKNCQVSSTLDLYHIPNGNDLFTSPRPSDTRRRPPSLFIFL